MWCRLGWIVLAAGVPSCGAPATPPPSQPGSTGSPERPSSSVPAERRPAEPDATAKPQGEPWPRGLSDAELRALARVPADGEVRCCPPLPCGSSACAERRELEGLAAAGRVAALRSEYDRRFGAGSYDRTQRQIEHQRRRVCGERLDPGWQERHCPPPPP